MNALRRNHTWNIVDRHTERKILDSKWVFKIEWVSDGSIEKFNGRLVVKSYPKFRDGITIKHLSQWYVSIPGAISCSSSLRMVSSPSNLY
jgi:hypothetical protein